MVTTLSLIMGILALLAFWAGVAWTDSYIIGMLFTVCTVMICKSLQPATLVLWDKLDRKFFPLPEIHEFRRERLDPTEDYVVPPESMGLRVLVMTEDLPYKGHKNLYEKMAADALEKLCREYPLFNLRLNAAYKLERPVQYVWSHCGSDGVNISKCVKAWLKSWGCYRMSARTQFRDMFLKDGTVEVPSRDGELVRYTVMVLFDGDLPVTLPENQPAQADESQQEAPSET